MTTQIDQFVYRQVAAEQELLDRAALEAVMAGCGVRVDRCSASVVIAVDPDVPAGELHEHWSRS